MKKLIVLLIITAILFSGCIGQKSDQKTIKIGDSVAVDYIGSLNGKIFDTSIESVAKENNLTSSRTNGPLKFVVGKGQVIKGLDEGIIGMKLGETDTLTIPPEKAYGPKDPQLVETIPIIQTIPTTRNLPKSLDIPVEEFDNVFGPGHKIGDEVQIPNTNVNLTIQKITTSNISATYNLSIGNEVLNLAPWKEYVIKIDDKNITIKSEVKKDDIIQLKGVAWNTTVVDVNSDNITLRHNFIPDTKMRAGFRQIKVHFNETHIILDGNNEFAGETLVFKITIKSIEKANSTSSIPLDGNKIDGNNNGESDNETNIWKKSNKNTIEPPITNYWKLNKKI